MIRNKYQIQCGQNTWLDMKDIRSHIQTYIRKTQTRKTNIPDKLNMSHIRLYTFNIYGLSGYHKIRPGIFLHSISLKLLQSKDVCILRINKRCTSDTFICWFVVIVNEWGRRAYWDAVSWDLISEKTIWAKIYASFFSNQTIRSRLNRASNYTSSCGVISKETSSTFLLTRKGTIISKIV